MHPSWPIIWNPIHMVYLCTYAHVYCTCAYVKCYSMYYHQPGYMCLCTKPEMYIHVYTFPEVYIHVYTLYMHALYIRVCTWYIRECTRIYSHARVLECIYMYIPCIYTYIHPRSRFEGSVKVYTADVPCTDRYIHISQMYILQLVSAFFVLPGWLACNQ